MEIAGSKVLELFIVSKLTSAITSQTDRQGTYLFQTSTFMLKRVAVLLRISFVSKTESVFSASSALR